MREDKSITIPELLFKQMALYCLEEDSRTPELEALIKKGIYDKIDRMTAHNLYTKYKTAPSDKDKEDARKSYLDLKGIPENFRW